LIGLAGIMVLASTAKTIDYILQKEEGVLLTSS